MSDVKKYRLIKKDGCNWGEARAWMEAGGWAKLDPYNWYAVLPTKIIVFAESDELESPLAHIDMFDSTECKLKHYQGDTFELPTDHAEKLLSMGLIEEVEEKHNGVAYVMPVCHECGNKGGYITPAIKTGTSKIVGYMGCCICGYLGDERDTPAEAAAAFGNVGYDDFEFSFIEPGARIIVDGDKIEEWASLNGKRFVDIDHIPDAGKMAYHEGSFMWACRKVLLHGVTAYRRGVTLFCEGGFVYARSEINDKYQPFICTETVDATDWEIQG